MNREDLRGRLVELWSRYLPEMRERLSVLQTAFANLKTGPIDTSEREKAIFAAHKLAGAMGTFGHAEGSKLARAIEHRFEEGGPWPEELGEVQSMLDRISLLLQ